MKPNLRSLLLLGLVFAMLSTSLIACEQSCKHDRVTDQVIAATCEQEGKTLHTCLDCGYEYATDIIQPSGHALLSTMFAPTCDRQGYTTYFCECGYSFSSDYISPLGHAMTEKVLDATCDEQGRTEQSCERCDYRFESNLTVPLGHSFNSTSVPVTCTHSGYTEHVCSVCEYTYRDYLHYSDIVPHAYMENAEVLARGLDISKANYKPTPTGEYTPLDWNAIKAAGFDFVILKIGSSASGLDPTFEMSYAGARAAGLDIGFYFFTYATTKEENQADADQVIEWLDGRLLEYPIFYDIEDASFDDDPYDKILPEIPDKSVVTDFCLAFIERIWENGYYGALYCNKSWLNSKLDTQKCLSTFDIWCAQYPNPTNEPILPDATVSWPDNEQLSAWQYTSNGMIESIQGTYFDFNYCYKDFPALMQKYHLNGY